jgi:hypothetical protein
MPLRSVFLHNELLLQIYRGLAHVTGALFAVGGALVGYPNLTQLVLLGVVALVSQWLLWFPVIRARHRAVDAAKRSADPLATADNASWGITRLRLDLAWPTLLSLYWLALLGLRDLRGAN